MHLGRQCVAGAMAVELLEKRIFPGSFEQRLVAETVRQFARQRGFACSYGTLYRNIAQWFAGIRIVSASQS